jgi:hypothetical protein
MQQSLIFSTLMETVYGAADEHGHLHISCVLFTTFEDNMTGMGAVRRDAIFNRIGSEQQQ